jgi:hypothetical protein
LRWVFIGLAFLVDVSMKRRPWAFGVNPPPKWLQPVGDGTIDALSYGAKPMIELGQGQPVAVGHLRYVFQHPTEPDFLIKIMRPDAIEERWTNGPWYRRFSRMSYYNGFVREFKEYVSSIAASPSGVSPLARIVGVEMTDLGLGQIVEKVRSDDGSLAPTLNAWVRIDGFTPAIEAAMADFLARLLEHNVIAADLHEWNVVQGSDSRGGPHLLMIDGFGEKNIVPHSSMSRRHNAKRTLKRYERMLARVRSTPKDEPSQG